MISCQLKLQSDTPNPRAQKHRYASIRSWLLIRKSCWSSLLGNWCVWVYDKPVLKHGFIVTQWIFEVHAEQATMHVICSRVLKYVIVPEKTATKQKKSKLGLNLHWIWWMNRRTKPCFITNGNRSYNFWMHLSRFDYFWEVVGRLPMGHECLQIKSGA